MKFYERPAVHIFLIALLGLLAYSNTFDVPFQWDEDLFISENPILNDLSCFLNPALAKRYDDRLYSAFISRYFGYLTFALNRMAGGDVAYYHAVNTAIHVINAGLVYFLVILTFKTPFLMNISAKGKNIALLTGLLFISHPVQTEAVTYIYQRHTSLVALFYLGALVLYVKWRLSSSPDQQFGNNERGTGRLSRYRAVAPYLLSLLFAVLAMKTKENAFTLPVAIALFEVMFFKDTLKRKLSRLLPFILTMFIIPFTLMNAAEPLWEAIDSASKTQPDISRHEYLFTQFPVVVTYLRLLLFPAGQNLDYDFPIFDSFFAPRVLFSFAVLFALFAVSLYLYFQSRKHHILKVISFGIFWFFVTLAVESSVISLQDVIFEHRIYLPSAGIFAAFSTMFLTYFEKLAARKRGMAAALAGIAIISLSSATYARNNLWRNEISLWEDVAKKSPYKLRVHFNLGRAYYRGNLPDKSIEHYEICFRLYPNHELAYKTHNGLARSYESKGMMERAIEHYYAALRIKPDYTEAHVNLGLLYLFRGQKQDARKEFEAAINAEPDNLKALMFLDYIYKSP